MSTTPVVIPDHEESKLQDILKIDLRNADYIHHGHGDVDIDWDHGAALVIKLKGGDLLVVVFLHDHHPTSRLIRLVPILWSFIMLFKIIYLSLTCSLISGCTSRLWGHTGHRHR